MVRWPGIALTRWAGQTVLWCATLVAAIALGGYLVLYAASAVSQLASLAALGLGAGATMTAASSMIMLAAPADRAGMAASVEEVSYELGRLGLGIAILGSLLTAVYSSSLVLPDTLEVNRLA